jgi:hypothetical protein
MAIEHQPTITSEDIKHALSAKYGAESELPSWTRPFIHAVEIVERLAPNVKVLDVALNVGKDLGSPGGNSASAMISETERVRIEEEAVTSLQSVSIGVSFVCPYADPSLQAIELSHGQNILPFIWFTDHYMRKSNWTKALDPALKATHLDPLNPASLIRLSVCYEHTREYVKAYDSLRSGMAMMPPSEKEMLADRLGRLRENARDMAANIVRRDPFDVMPLELIISIMKFGLMDHRDFVLNCSSVNRRWRETLVHKCPELWGTLTFNWKQMSDKRFDGKIDEWIKRCDKKPEVVEIINAMPAVGIGKIPKALQGVFTDVKTLRMEVKDNKAIQRFIEKFKDTFCQLEHLRMHGGDIEQFKLDVETHPDLDCGLLDTRSDEHLKSVDISNVDFRDCYLKEYNQIGGLYFRQRDQARSRKRRYPALESLVITGCKFDTASNRGMLELYDEEIGPFGYDERVGDPKPEEPEPKNGRYKTCPLHAMLRAAPNLRFLKIVCDAKMVNGRDVGTQTQPPPNTRVELPNVVRLIVPPVSVWTVDICAPNVESLSFVLAHDALRNKHYDRPLPMIPAVEESPVDIHNLAKITHLGFECAKSDTVDRLEAWLSRVPNLTSLSIHGNKVFATSDPSPGSEANSNYRSSPVAMGLLESLINSSEWIRKLDTLEINQCDLSDEQIVKFIKMRKETPGMTPLARLILLGRNDLSLATHAWLHEAVKLPNGKSGFAHDTSRVYPPCSAKGVCDLCEV